VAPHGAGVALGQADAGLGAVRQELEATRLDGDVLTFDRRLRRDERAFGAEAASPKLGEHLSLSLRYDLMRSLQRGEEAAVQRTGAYLRMISSTARPALPPCPT
jgi:hypothetical protein